MHRREDATIELSQEQRTELEKVARSRRTPQAVAQRADDGRWDLAGTTASNSACRSQRFASGEQDIAEQGLPGLRSEPRPSRPTLDDQRVADLLNQALQTRPAKQTHWSVRSFAAEANIIYTAMFEQTGLLLLLRHQGFEKEFIHLDAVVHGSDN